MKVIRRRLEITGIVQGVGFRPTVFRYANQFKLAGFINNNSQGVWIEVEGESEAIFNFTNQLKNSPPPQAVIDQFKIFEMEPIGSVTFEIIKSLESGDKSVEISPDLATCSDCLAELNDSKNRRFQYPFINCTNCGPRFSIIRDRPYDRPLTSMAEFPMCPECLSEYQDPMDRRFHAQPNACPVCGPKLYLVGTHCSEDPTLFTVKKLKDGFIVGIKGLGGFNVATDALNLSAVTKLRERKKRATKSFAVMMKDLATVKNFCHISDCEIKELTSSKAPIVLLRKKTDELDHISPDNHYLGVMLPYTPLHHIIMQNFDALLLTSANRKEEPIVIDDQGITKLIEQGIIDFALSHNREIVHRADDSIVQFIDGVKQIIRYSRGYVPTAIKNNFGDITALSFGAQMKNSFCISTKNKNYLSQHIGELLDHRNFIFQQEQIIDLKKLFEIKPSIKIADAHSGFENYHEADHHCYHHYAHLLSVVSEHNILWTPRTLGVICDGTGLGTDNTIWGFEFLRPSKNFQSFDRIATLATFPLIGGELAITEIDRIRLALTRDAQSEKEKMMLSLINQNLNCPQTSSLGRLFDGIAALLGICQYSDYEAQGAILLQKEAEKFQGKIVNRYLVQLLTDDDLIKIDYQNLIKAIQTDHLSGKSKSEMAMKFHLWVRDAILSIIDLDQHKPDQLIFSGGCFQNVLLYKLVIEAIKQRNIKYYINCETPINDAGISLGQSYFARSLLCASQSL